MKSCQKTNAPGSTGHSKIYPAFSRIIDIIYPPRCPICRKFLWKEGSEKEGVPVYFCRTCLADFQEITPPFCPICGSPFVLGIAENHLCEDCLRSRPLYEAAAAPFLYKGSLMKAIHQFKYGARSYMADFLGPLLAQFAESWVSENFGGELDDLLVIPVPLHAKKLRERGFNQSLLLAKHVARQLYAGLDFLSLRRIKYTLPQTGLGRKERRKNVRGAFQLKNFDAVKGKRVLLVDDVSTTGNTLNECAVVLKKSGCKKVICLVLARTSSP